MGTIALLSDIHANQEALEAVLAHIDGQKNVEAIYCLGDCVGYGPSPEEVIDLLEKRCAFTLMGNHDFAMLTAPHGFNPIAAGAIECQRNDLEPGIFSLPRKQHRWDFLKHLPQEKIFGDDVFVHASPRDKIFEYILPEDAEYNPGKLEGIFESIERRCFVGHTHRPGVMTVTPAWTSAEDLGNEYEFRGDEKVIVNVSSVGQPRDRDPRACYATLTEDGVTFHRVEYDIDTTVRKVEENDCLDNLCGERLRQGR